MDYFENNKKQQALLALLASYGIEVPNNIDAHSVEWILDMIYLKFDSKELKKFMNELESKSLGVFGNVTK